MIVFNQKENAALYGNTDGIGYSKEQHNVTVISVSEQALYIRLWNVVRKIFQYLPNSKGGLIYV